MTKLYKVSHRMAPFIYKWIKETELNSECIVLWTAEIDGILTTSLQNELIEELINFDRYQYQKELFELAHDLPSNIMFTLNGVTDHYDFTKDIKELKGTHIKFYKGMHDFKIGDFVSSKKVYHLKGEDEISTPCLLSNGITISNCRITKFEDDKAFVYNSEYNFTMVVPITDLTRV